MRLPLKAGLLLASVLVACHQDNLSDVDKIRREVMLDEITGFAEARPLKTHTFCLAVSEDVPADIGVLDYEWKATLKDPPPELMTVFQRLSLHRDAKVLPVSRCDRWFTTKAPRVDTVPGPLLLVNNITFKDPNHATAQMEIAPGIPFHSQIVIYQLERRDSRWVITRHDLISGG